MIISYISKEITLKKLLKNFKYESRYTKKNKRDKSNIFNLSYTFTKCHSITVKVNQSISDEQMKTTCLSTIINFICGTRCGLKLMIGMIIFTVELFSPLCHSKIAITASIMQIVVTERQVVDRNQFIELEV